MASIDLPDVRHERQLFCFFSRHCCTQMAIYISSYSISFQREREKRSADEEIVCAQCLPAGACFLNGQLTKWPLNNQQTRAPAVVVVYNIYTYALSSKVSCWLPQCVGHLYSPNNIYRSLFASLYMLFVRLLLRLVSSLFSFVRFFSPFSHFCLLKRRPAGPKVTQLSRDIRCVCARPAQQHPTRVAVASSPPPCMGIDSGNETFRSSPYIDTLGYEQHGSPSWRLRDLT